MGNAASTKYEEEISEDSKDEEDADVEKPFSLIHYDDVVSNPPPMPRSGHRIFVIDRYMYVIGGFTMDPSPKIFEEIWKLDLTRNCWTKLKIHSQFPRDLASFSCCAHENGKFVVYGGTNIPFGADMDPDVYVGQVTIRKCRATGNRSGIYGHVMLWDEEKKVYYTVGGTDGQNYGLDVHMLTMTGTEENVKCSWTPIVTRRKNGMYRMEATLDGGLILLFGGSNNHTVCDFEEIVVFNTNTGKYESITSYPDPAHGFPAARRYISFAICYGAFALPCRLRTQKTCKY